MWIAWLILLSGSQSFSVEGGKNLWVPSNAEEKTIMESTVRLVRKTSSGKFDQFCTGALTGPREVLTAGHCMNAFLLHESPGTFFVEIYDKDAPDKIRRIQISDVRSKLWKQGGDLALLSLNMEVPKKYSVPIAYDGCESYSGFAAGFGWADKFTSTKPERVKSATYKLVLPSDHDKIMEIYSKKLGIPEGQGGDYITMKGSDGQVCKGDSGGPLFCKAHGVLSVAGIMSFKGRIEPMNDRQKVEVLSENCVHRPYITGSKLSVHQKGIQEWREELFVHASAIDVEGAQ